MNARAFAESALLRMSVTIVRLATQRPGQDDRAELA